MSETFTFYIQPWYRKSPYFESTKRAGCRSWGLYNHMLLPTLYDDPATEYWALLNGVTMWDVAVERCVEISGPDAFEFTNLLTCRDLTTCAVGQCKYVLLIARRGGIVNDPVLLRLEEDRFWLALADSDALLYAKGVAAFAGLDVDIEEADVAPMQIQGPRSRDVVRALFGDEIADLRYYWCAEAEVNGIPVVVSRTGWTGEVGYEVYLRDSSRGDELWRLVEEAGAPFDIRAIAPSEARRSRRASSTTARTCERRTRRSTSPGWNGWWNSTRAPTSSGRTRCGGSPRKASIASSSASTSKEHR